LAGMVVVAELLVVGVVIKARVVLAEVVVLQ